MIFLFFFLLLFNPANSDVGTPDNSINIEIDSLYYIDSIYFLGNKKTKDGYLKIILGLKPKNSYSLKTIEGKVNFLNSINGIYNAKYYLENKKNKYILKVYVDEQKTLLPIINFGFQPTNKWFQIGAADINFLGKGNELLFYYQNNQSRNSAELVYKQNRIFKSRFSLSMNLLRWESIEPVLFEGEGRYDYNFTISQLGTELIYQHNNELSGAFGISAFQEDYFSILRTNSTGPLNLTLNKLLTKWRGNYNTLTYDGIYKRNYELEINYQNVYTMEYNQLFHIVTFNYLQYYKLKKRSELVYKVHLGTSTNNSSPFAPFVIDSYGNVRGAGDRVIRGTSISSMNLEWRQELFKINHIILQGVLFHDAAAIRLPGETISIPFIESNVSVGIGIRMHYTKIFNAILRVDYGFEYNENHQQLIFGIGQYF